MHPPPTASTSSWERFSTVSSTADTVRGLGVALRDGSTSPRDLLDRTLAHIAVTDDRVHAYLRPPVELAERQADDAARMLAEHPESASPLCGIPMAIKDVLCVEDLE